MSSSKGIRAGRAFVELFADDSKLVRGLKAAQAKLKAFGASVRAMGTQMMGVGAAVGALLAAVWGAAQACFIRAGSRRVQPDLAEECSRKNSATTYPPPLTAAFDFKGNDAFDRAVGLSLLPPLLQLDFNRSQDGPYRRLNDSPGSLDGVSALDTYPVAHVPNLQVAGLRASPWR